MTTIGGEVPQLRSLEKTFEREAQAVQELTTRIRGTLDSTWWKGPASDRFRDAWNSQFEPTLRKLDAALLEAAGEVHRRTEALIQAGS